jgi:uncharacterized protein (DUF885 family)
MRALRSGRAYVDAGLHTGRMSYGEAVKFFQDNFYISGSQAQSEVLRISLAPTESLSYIIGMDRILEMRGNYERSGPKKPDLKRFHSFFLRQGKIPLPDIEAELERQNNDPKETAQ